MQDYVNALCKDISHKGNLLSPENYEVVTIFFGGGTPSLLSIAQFDDVLTALRKNFIFANDAYLSLEANPETVNEDYLKNLKSLGFHRISFGVQSFNDKHLATIGRVHNAQTAINVVQIAHNAGFGDINIDLIYALPHQIIDDFENCLDIALQLPITHISCYALTIEEGTPLAGEQCSPLRNAMADEDIDRQMFALAKQKLANAGFVHYEISNWAKYGYECRHNVGYWTHRQYLGLGLGSSSFFANCRYKKTDDLQAYINGDFSLEVLEELDETALMAEKIILGLRMINGINATDVKNPFDVKIKKLIRGGLLTQKGDNITLTPKGIDLSNTVFSEIL